MFTHINVAEGIEEGSIDLLGCSEGSKEGCSEGSKEGCSEGAKEGCSEGAKDGCGDIREMI
jgi:hypothetical protein